MRPTMAVFIGGVVDIVLTNLFQIPVLIYAFNLMAEAKGRFPGINQAALVYIDNDPVLSSIQLFSGALASILGGYVAAWISKNRELAIGALSSFLCVGLAIYHLASGYSSGRELMMAADIVVAPSLGMLGGFLKSKQRAQKALT